MDGDMSLAEQVAHKIMDNTLTDVLKGALPLYEEKSRLEAYHEMEILRHKVSIWDGVKERDPNPPVLKTVEPGKRAQLSLEEATKRTMELFVRLGITDSAEKAKKGRDDLIASGRLQR